MAAGAIAASTPWCHCRHTHKFLAPSEATLRRVLQRLDPVELDRRINDWLRSHLQDQHIAALAVDGKCARTAAKIKGQGLMLFGALDTHTKLFCRQIQIPAKTNEIPTLKDLLRELDLRGTLVSADARNRQTANAHPIVAEKRPITCWSSKPINPSSSTNWPACRTRRKVFFSYHTSRLTKVMAAMKPARSIPLN